MIDKTSLEKSNLYITNVCKNGNHRACGGHKVDGHGCDCGCHND